MDMVKSNVAVAAQQLEGFYADVLGIAGDVWGSQPAQNFRECSFGGFDLSLRSNQPIEWDWIQAFLTDMVR